MSLSIFQWYCIGINIIAFLVFAIDFLIYKHGGDMQLHCSLFENVKVFL